MQWASRVRLSCRYAVGIGINLTHSDSDMLSSTDLSGNLSYPESRTTGSQGDVIPGAIYLSVRHCLSLTNRTMDDVHGIGDAYKQQKGMSSQHPFILRVS